VFLRIRPRLLEGAHAMDPEMHGAHMDGMTRHDGVSHDSTKDRAP
jgi:hypothetical protein